ncbi:MAG: ribosome maturation factor RimM [Actinomycetales bacterium]|nr:ribosome maturation factor RimM [Actinomycetales bacterium]
MSRSTKLRVGRLLKAHGLKGAIKLELYTDSPNERFVPGAVFELQVPEESPWFGKTVKVAELRWYNQAPVIFLEGITDRSGAESLIKAILLLDTDADKLPEEPDAWYDHQLVGLKVLRDGVEVGEVVRVEHMPAQDLLIIQNGEREVMLPFVKAMVPSLDIAAGTITVTPPIGLFEEVLPELATPEPAPPADEASEE